jgi:hypothetical protein
VRLIGSKTFCAVTNIEIVTGTTSKSVSVVGVSVGDISVGVAVFASGDIPVGLSVFAPVGDVLVGMKVGMKVFVAVGGGDVGIFVGMVVPVPVGGIPVGFIVAFIVGFSLFVSVRGVAMGILVGVSVFVPLSVGLRLGDFVVGSCVSLVMGRLEGTAVGTETLGVRDGTVVGYSSFCLPFFIALVGEAVGTKLFACALVFRCSPRS